MLAVMLPEKGERMKMEVLGYWLPNARSSYVNADAQFGVVLLEGQFQPEVEDRTFYTVIMVLPQVGPTVVGMIQHEGPENQWAYQQTVKPDDDLRFFLPELSCECWPNVSAAMVDISNAMNRIASFDR